MMLWLKNGFCYTGLAAIVYGCWLIYRPAAFLLGGLLLFIIALVMDRASETNGSR